MKQITQRQDDVVQIGVEVTIFPNEVNLKTNSLGTLRNNIGLGLKLIESKGQPLKEHKKTRVKTKTITTCKT